jgi:nucleotide-binding universal stress UspA family protein
VAGDPIRALTAASDRAAAVIVDRSDGTGVATAFVGSVGRALIRDAACPVFLIG